MFDVASLSNLTSKFVLYAPLAAGATDSWLTKWLTPIWFLGVGVIVGFLLLGIFMLVTRILSAIPAWEGLSRSAGGHAFAAGITTMLSFACYYYLIADVQPKEQLGYTEPIMLVIASTLLMAIVGWSIVFCSSAQASKNAVATLGEGAAGYLNLTALIVVGIGLLSTLVVEKPLRSFASIPQLFSTGETKFQRQIEPTAGVSADEAPYVKVDLPFDRELLDAVEITTKQSITLADAASSEYFKRAPIRMERDEKLSWNRTRKASECPIPLDEGEQLFVQNREIDAAQLEIRVITRPAVPEAGTILITAVTVFLIGLTILLQQAVAPRVSAVALATVKNELAQPLFLVLMMFGILAVLLFVFLPFNTFGEDIKLLKECGITTIMLLAAFQGIWSASSSISEEIEGRTALTVLSKPIQRRSFIIGKFLGVFWLLFLMFIVLGIFELGAVAYKPIYDARENSISELTWQMCHEEMISTLPGLAMAFMEALLLSAISVALATRLPQLANIAICFAIYVVGNLTTSLVSSTQEGFEIVKFVAQLVATIIPILEHFSLQAAIDSGNRITMSLLSGSLVYCLLYVLLSMFLALLLFEDRDLA
jgi:ABC-type transport system involved in multi-copper enzyme maturation permease subunit